MTKHCPKCNSAFQDSTAFCSDDGAPLAAGDASDISPDAWVDIYAAANLLEAERIEGFLKDEPIASQIRQAVISQLPLLGDTHFIISVLSLQRNEAVQKIFEAQADGVISQDGAFL